MFRFTSPFRLFLLFEAALVVCFVLLMKCIGRASLIRKAVEGKPDCSTSIPLEQGKWISRAVQRACAHLPFHVSGLDRSLAGWIMITLKGYQSVIELTLEPHSDKSQIPSAYVRLVSGNNTIIGCKTKSDNSITFSAS